MKEWLKDAIFYEIYPQSFKDTNGDGIGDLQGVIEKLDYIKDLGFNAIWLNPCFESPFHDAGYDISDYCKIAPRYGTNEDARRLFAEAHKRNMHVLFDLVPGHTSIEHEWFKQSMKSTDKNPNEFHARYIWTGGWFEKMDGVTNITGVLNGFCDRGDCATNFFTTQPALNYGFLKPDPKKPWQISMDSPDARATKNAIWEAMKFWLSMGCDGFRVDMAFSIIKNDDKNSSGTIKFWQEIRERLDKEFPNAAMVSEWGAPDKSLNAGFDMDFLMQCGSTHYLDLFRENPYFAGVGDLTEFWKSYKALSKKVGKLGLLCLISGNHDIERMARKLSPEQIKLAFTFLLTMPGATFVYYGDEIGMKYIEDQPSVEGGYFRTGSRTPMQWDSSLNAGFSSAKPSDLYIPLDANESRPNVAAQEKDENSILNTVKKLNALRNGMDSLKNLAPIEVISCGKKDEVLAYVRGGDVLVAINPFNSQKEISLPKNFGDKGEPIFALGGAKIQNGKIVLPKQSAIII